MEIQRSFFEIESHNSSPLIENAFQLHNRRYIGNKHKLTDWIFSILNKECLGDSFTDIFAGTGTVGAIASRYFNKIKFKKQL